MDQSEHQAGPSNGRALRTRVKSQRAIESEQTDRLLARVKREEQKGHTTVVPKKRVQKQRKVEIYCICKTSGDDGRPMIECGICNDWFHFDCVKLEENEAEEIHKYVCGDCHERTGEQTSHVYDITIFPSPSPPPGFGLPPSKPSNKRKPSVEPARRISPRPSASGTSSSDNSESEAEADSQSSSSETAYDTRPTIKRARRSGTPIRAGLPPARNTAGRKVSTPSTPLGLPPARAHVLQRLVQVIRRLFEGRQSEDKSEKYAEEVEIAIWAGFKETVAGKETAGGRYKAQFNLLSSTLLKDLRPELRDSILEHSLTPAQVAVLTPADLASVERAKEIEAAKQAVLQQTVKTKSIETGAIRLGRDGLERVEDYREKEMMAIQFAERAARDTRQMRDSEGGDVEPPSGSAKEDVRSPEVMHHQKPLSIDIPVSSTSVAEITKSLALPTPARSFSLSSAWAAKDTATVDLADVTTSFGDDQNQLDLSDILADSPDPGLETNAPVGTFDDTVPVVWTGSIANNIDPAGGSAPVVMRHISAQTSPPDWDLLLPHREICMTGALKPEDANAFLETSRCLPSRELIAVVITVDPHAEDEAKAHWQTIIDHYSADGRWRVYYPYGKQGIPPRAAKDVYWQVLQPSDPLPSISGLIDGFKMPDIRSETALLGFFVRKRDTVPLPKTRVITPAQTRPSPVQGSVSAPPIQNDKLQALMASLNPDVLKSLAGPSPPQGSVSPLASVGYIPATQPAQEHGSHPYFSQPHSPAQGYGYPAPYMRSDYQPSYEGQPSFPPPHDQGPPAGTRRHSRGPWQNRPPSQTHGPTYGSYGEPQKSGGRGSGSRNDMRGGNDRDNGWNPRGSEGGYRRY